MPTKAFNLQAFHSFDKAWNYAVSLVRDGMIPCKTIRIKASIIRSKFSYDSCFVQYNRILYCKIQSAQVWWVWFAENRWDRLSCFIKPQPYCLFLVQNIEFTFRGGFTDTTAASIFCCRLLSMLATPRAAIIMLKQHSPLTLHSFLSFLHLSRSLSFTHCSPVHSPSFCLFVSNTVSLKYSLPLPSLDYFFLQSLQFWISYFISELLLDKLLATFYWCWFNCQL